MPQLVYPSVRFHRSFLAAWDEIGGDDAARWMGVFDSYHRTREELTDPASFAAYVEDLRRDELPDSPRPPEWVPATMLWYAEGTEWLGRLSIRHSLNPHLFELGGHIGYVVRPSFRRRGYATAMLAESLPIAAKLGIDQALVTCDTDNLASRKVIESAGGILDDERHGKLRFWVPTHPLG